MIDRFQYERYGAYYCMALRAGFSRVGCIRFATRMLNRAENWG